MELIKRIPAEGAFVEQQVVTEYATGTPHEPKMKFMFESETTLNAGGWLEVRYDDDPLTGGLQLFYCDGEREDQRMAGYFGV